MKTPTPHNTGDIRCLGTKSDEDLAREWKPHGHLGDGSRCLTCERNEAIEKELGKDRLEFLVFKIKTEERLEKLEALKVDTEFEKQIQKQKEYMERERDDRLRCIAVLNGCDGYHNTKGEFIAFAKNHKKPWYKRIYSLLTEILCPGVSVSAGIGILVGLLFCLIISKFS